MKNFKKIEDFKRIAKLLLFTVTFKNFSSCAKNILPRIPKIHTQIKLVLERWANYGNIPKDKNTFFEKMHKKSIKNDAWLQETWDKLKEEANKQ